MHFSPHSLGLQGLLAAQSSTAMPNCSGETLSSPCCLNGSVETFFSALFLPSLQLSPDSNLRSSLPSAVIPQLGKREGLQLPYFFILFLNASFCAGEYIPAVRPFASQMAPTDRSFSRYGATQRKGKSPAFPMRWLGGECLDLTSLAPQ